MKPNEILQTILDDKGMTHVQLAKATGVASQTIDKRCAGQAVMRVDTLCRMYGAVGYKLVAAPIDGLGAEYEVTLR